MATDLLILEAGFRVGMTTLAVLLVGCGMVVGWVAKARTTAAEIERLREAIRRLADQDATLSVKGGNVTVTMDATLTDAEREAIRWAAWEGPVRSQAEGAEERADTLRGLLERTQTTHATQGEGSVTERDTISADTPASTEPDLRGPAVIVNGSVIGGFTFTGPFDTVDAAAEWHTTKRLAGHLGLPTAIVLLEKPRQEVFDE